MLHDEIAEAHELTICDMSSDLFTREIDLRKFAGIYCHSQKNLGIPGFVLFLVREDMLARCRRNLPDALSFLSFANHPMKCGTPPTAAIIIAEAMLDWILQMGGVRELETHLLTNANSIYSVLDSFPDVYSTFVRTRDRSRASIVFKCKSESQTHTLKQRIRAASISGLDGHYSCGGFRVSLCNSTRPEDVAVLTAILREFGSE